MDTTLHVKGAVEEISKDCYNYVIYELSFQPLVLVHKRRLQEYEDRNVGPPLKKIKNVDLVKSLPIQREMQEVEFNISGIMNKYIIRFHACVIIYIRNS